MDRVLLCGLEGEVVVLGGGWKLPLLKSGFLMRGSLGGSLLKGLAFCCDSTRWAGRQTSSKVE